MYSLGDTSLWLHRKKYAAQFTKKIKMQGRHDFCMVKWSEWVFQDLQHKHAHTVRTLYSDIQIGVGKLHHR